MNIRTCILLVTVIMLCDKFQWSETLDNSELEDSLWNFVNPNGVEGSLSYTEDISNSSSSGIVQTCKAFLEHFAKESSLFTRCLVENARPFRFCETCVTYYERASTVYTDLTTDANCVKELLTADRVQVLTLVYQNMNNVWTTAYCPQCFASVTEESVNATVNSTLAESTLEFFDLFNNMTHCMNNTMQDIDPESIKHGNSSFCVKCQTQYRSLNDKYTAIMDETKSQICMDVVDMMNYTRLMWSEGYHCSHRNGELAPVLVITGVICALPVIFYVCNRLTGQVNERTIVVQKRLKHPKSYGSMSNSQQTLLNSQRT
ncbi:osteopetrosis-associated transmembrane protein 1-like [Haliotis rufescens]|uniref:osteopetrosis-associated transmembrane protein 1-like n=1 Tax=Haliotis rufescens TaxID=6454 RepID=UPI00201ED443|nr:osteopetrosis-associated transmembrane protein 1-like [Haliotis rufescens]